MERLFKVRNQYPLNHPNYLLGHKDGQQIDMRPDGFFLPSEQSNHRKSQCVITTPEDYWTVRGSTDWKSTIGTVLEMKKLIGVADSNGKNAWEAGYLESEKQPRKRDWFTDFKFLLDMGWITQAQFDSIYNPAINHIPISLNVAQANYLFHEDGATRRESQYSSLINAPEFVSTGTFTIGAAGSDYTTVSGFVADIDADLTGDLTGEIKDEEIAESTVIVFDPGTNSGNLLKLTSVSGAEHDGTGYGNGARINFTSADRLSINQATGKALDDFELSNIAFDISGTNRAIDLVDGGDAGLFTVNRIFVTGDTSSIVGIDISDQARNLLVKNNIICNIGEAANDSGILIEHISAGRTLELYNNTFAKNYENIRHNQASSSATLTIKNNITQGDTGGGDFVTVGAGWGTTAKNISEDATSPDVALRSINLHDATSNFQDYTNDNYLMASGGSEIDTLKAGEDLTGIFTDDIIDNTRLAATFFIGASWINLAAAGVLLRTLALTGAGR